MTRKASFNIMGIVFMMIAIWLGTFVGSGIASWIGFAGTIVGSFIVGMVIYALYMLISGKPIKLWQGVIFSALVFIANIIAGAIYGVTGIGGGIIGLAFTAVILSFLVGYFMSGTGAPISTTTAKSSGKTKSKRKR